MKSPLLRFRKVLEPESVFALLKATAVLELTPSDCDHP